MADLQPLRMAALQLNAQDDVPSNLDTVARLVGEAARAGARAVLLPENFAYMGPEEGKRGLAEVVGDDAAPLQQRLIALAREHGVWLLCGGFPERSPDPARPFNTHLVLDPTGAVAAAYRKIHLFDVDLADGNTLRESDATSAGDTPVVVEIEGLKVGLSICYDLRFPELYRRLVGVGAEVLVVPAAFTLTTGKDHWHVLLRARAIEAQCWVVAAAQWGRHPRGRQCYGHALVADPWGTVVAEASDRVGLVIADLDPRWTRQVRAQIPCLVHRRL